jgi:ankyrin repeat protein
MHNCLRLGHNSNLVPAGSIASGVNMKDTSNNEKMDISKDQQSEISRQTEEKEDTAPEDDGVGENSKEENEMESSDNDFREFASILKMDMKPELKSWFVKSEYKVHVAAFRKEFRFLEEMDYHPLHVAVWAGAVDIVDMLIKEAKVDVNIQVGGEWLYLQGWTALHFAASGDHEEMVYRLVMTYGADPNVQANITQDTPLHFASHEGSAGAMKGFLRAECKLRDPSNVNGTNSPESSGTKSHKIDVNATTSLGYTALHIAAINGHSKVVQTLLKFPDIKLTIENKYGDTALDVASKYEKWEVFDLLRLKITPEVTDYNEPYYRDRQASVDAANAILVGAALIASVTFAAWLQPPLGYSTFYNEQYSNDLPAPPTSNPQYASFDHHPALNWFWAFNSLSFFMAIATVMSGAQSVLPSHRVTVKQEVRKLGRNLLITSTLLALSMVFVLLAFAIAGVMVVPPVFKSRASMYFTILIGGGVSVVFLCKLVWRIFCAALEMGGLRNPIRGFCEPEMVSTFNLNI